MRLSFISVFHCLLPISFASCHADLVEPDLAQSIRQLNSQQRAFHEGVPLGVPNTYDWQQRPVLKQGNDPKGHKAIIGWGHVFWQQGARNPNLGLSIRNFKVFLCAGPHRSWHLIQDGPITGKQFIPDFKHNISMPPSLFSVNNNTATVQFDYGYAFHFWPSSDRVRISGTPHCGVIVVAEAKLSYDEEGLIAHDNESLLMGMGADYWRDLHNPWNGIGSNIGIALGQLRLVSPKWSWHGVSTASDSDIANLLTLGYSRSP